MQNDLISRDYSVKALREYAEQKHAVGQTELANGILKAVNFLEKEENVPTAYDVEKVVAELEELYDNGTCPAKDEGEYDCNSIKTCGECFKERMVKIVRNGGKE